VQLVDRRQEVAQGLDDGLVHCAQASAVWESCQSSCLIPHQSCATANCQQAGKAIGGVAACPRARCSRRGNGGCWQTRPGGANWLPELMTERKHSHVGAIQRSTDTPITQNRATNHVGVHPCRAMFKRASTGQHSSAPRKEFRLVVMGSRK